jgi:hypothetical protein
LPTKPQVSLSTITDSQDDLSIETLKGDNFCLAVKEVIPDMKLNIGKSLLIGGESAGPNSRKSI